MLNTNDTTARRMVLKEVTQWATPTTPNHIYDVVGDRIVRYRPPTQARWNELAKPLRFDVRRRKFLEVDEDYLETKGDSNMSEDNTVAPTKKEKKAKVAKAPKEAKVSKVDLAADIVRANPKATRAELIVMFMQELSMTKAGASTYVQLARKRVAG